MKYEIKAAMAAVALSVAAVPAHADSLGILSPATVEAAVVGSTEMIVHIPQQSGSTAMTVAPIDVTGQQLVNATPGSGQMLDMSGADGSLRSCYSNGGIAKQNDTLSYYCAFPDAGPATQSAYVSAPNADTGYNGTNNVADPALLDCVGRGGSLIQLSANGQFACAM